MKHLINALAVAVACLSPAAFAADAASPKNSQQTKMAECNKDAGDKKGDERKTFMKSCLSAKATPTQQEKMKSCNADEKAKTLKGDERKAFMKQCLSA
jgi:hypothetical protein